MSYQALLFCPDEKTARLVTQVLNELDFSVEPSNEPFAAVKRLMAQHFDAVVVDCDNEQNATLLFKSARNSASNQSSLAVAVVEGQAGVAKAFRIGANLVLTKPINVDQSKGTLRVARGLLRKSDANKTIAATPATPSATQTKATPALQKSVPVQPAAKNIPAATAPSTRFTPVAQAAAPEREVHESAALDLPPDLSPAAESTVVRPANKQYAWQKPVSKPTGPMATALQRASEEDNPLDLDDSDEQEELTNAVANRVSPSAPEAPSFSVSASTSAASAPAPAKQRIEPSAIPNPAVKAPAQATQTPIAPSKLAISQPPVDEPAPAPVPAVAEIHPEAAPKKSGSNVGLIAAIVVLVLAGGGYFGWTKFHSSQTASPAPQNYTLQSAPKTAASQSTSATVSNTEQKPVAEQKPSAGIATPQTSHVDDSQTSVKPPSETEKSTKSNASTKSDKSEEEETGEPAAPQPMIVKSAAPRQQAVTSAPVAAPDPLMASAGSGEKNLAGIASTGLEVAKPIQQSLRVSQGVLQGRLVKKVQPIYPANSMRLRIQGVVQLAATISKDGEVVNVKQTSGDPTLGRAAVDAVKQWKYKPYLLDGRPVEIQTQISVDFKLPR